jgi:LysR family transcriptional regulator (chromosome initiation inhibitor)
MLDYDQLATLAAILRHGGFDAAARELNITQSAVSQRLRALEDRVGHPLVLRGSPCVGTALGIRLARHAEDVALMEAQLDVPVADVVAPQRVKIAVNADSLAAWLVEAMRQAQKAAPQILFEAVVDDQDHSADWLKRGEVSAAITSRPTPPVGCDSHVLGALRYHAVASPAWIAHHCPDGVSDQVLRLAPMMTYDPKDRLQLIWLEREFGAGRRPPSHYLPSTHAFVTGALAGLGWGMNPENLIRDHLEAGRLVALVPDRPLDVPHYWQVSRRMAPALKSVTRAFLRSARDVLHPVSQG